MNCKRARNAVRRTMVHDCKAGTGRSQPANPGQFGRYGKRAFLLTVDEGSGDPHRRPLCSSPSTSSQLANWAYAEAQLSVADYRKNCVRGKRNKVRSRK